MPVVKKIWVEINIDRAEALIDVNETMSLKKLVAQKYVNRKVAQAILQKYLDLKPCKSQYHQEISIYNKQRKLLFCLKLKK